MRYKKGQIVKVQGIMAYMDFSGVFEIIQPMSIHEAIKKEKGFINLWFSSESEETIVSQLDKDCLYEAKLLEDTHYAKAGERIIFPESFVDLERSYRLPHANEDIAIKRCHIHDDLAISVPEEVIQAMKDVLSILDENYGEIRDVDGDLGGYALIIKKYDEIADYLADSYLDLDEVIAESVEVINCANGETWVSALIIQMSDYAIQIFMPYEETPLNLLNQIDS